MPYLVVFFILQMIGLSILYLRSRSNYTAMLQEHGKAFPLSFLAPISLYVLDKLRVLERLPLVVNRVNHYILFLYGQKKALIYTRLFLAQVLSAMLLVLVGTTLFTILSKDMLLAVFGGVLVLALPLLLLRGLDRQYHKKRNELLLELPKLLNTLVLLVNAGETIQKALIHTVLQQKNPEQSELYREMLVVVHELQNNSSLTQALENLNKRCRLQEMSIFTSTVIMNYRRGGKEFVLALRMLSKEMWEKRKATSRTLGEQASSKLVFPMVLIFLVVMLIIATPAIMLF